MTDDRRTPADEFERVRRGILRIARVAVAQGTVFPGEMELARLLDCGRGQVRRVMGSIEHDGIVLRRQGVPTRIDPAALALSLRLDDRLDVATLLLESGYQPSARLLSATAGEVPTPAWTRSKAPTAAVADSLQLFLADGRPAVVERVELLDGSAADAEEPIDARIERAAGEPALWDACSLRIAQVGDTIAAALELEPASSVLSAESIHITRSGRHIARSVRWYGSEYFTAGILRTSYPRWDAEARWRDTDGSREPGDSDEQRNG